MGHIQPLRLTWNQVRKEVEDFRAKYVNPPDKIPVPIIEIAEFDLRLAINPQPGLRHRSDIEAFLESDLQTLTIDQELYEDPRQEKRLRFTYAHEIRHLVLHKKQIEKTKFKTEQEWIEFRLKMKEEDNSWFERQANEFAGRLLVPKNHLTNEIKKHRDGIRKYREMIDNGDEPLKDAVSRLVCDAFFVSSAVVYRRINAEQIWDDLRL